jgi:hypothetical protein
MTRLGLGVVLAAALAVAAARAEPERASDCLWQAAAPLREGLRASLRAHGGIVDGLTDAQAAALMRTCRLSDTGASVNLIITTLRGRTLTLEAQEGLQASLKMSPSDLAAAWRRLPPPDRRALARAFNPPRPMPETLAATLDGWAASLGVQSDADRALLVDYAEGQAMLDSLDGR